MFAVMGVTGRVGGVVARILLAAGKDVRAVVRSTAKGIDWERQGCEVAVGQLTDTRALATSFSGTEGVFIVVPEGLDSAVDYAESRQVIVAIREALLQSLPDKVVCLSSIGAHVRRPSLLRPLGIMEEQLSDLPMPVAFVRAAWLMENAMSDLNVALAGETLKSYLRPLDRPIPMVASADIGSMAAAILQQNWDGRRIVEIEGPRAFSPRDVADAIERFLGTSMPMVEALRCNWEEEFRALGVRNPVARAQMMDGFNEGWLTFEGGGGVLRRMGRVPLDVVITRLFEDVLA